MKKILYYGTDIEVNLGDHVLYRSMLFFWKWKKGRISYVPGKSKFHPEMEFNGLSWVGVSGVDGTFRGVIVQLEDNTLRKTVKFVSIGFDDNYLTPEGIRKDEW